MSDLVAAAELLRVVRTAEEDFLGRFAVDCLIDDRRVIEKLVADLWISEHSPSSGDGGWTMN
jgi:hypothetical protein